jgi:predicted acyltransferase
LSTLPGDDPRDQDRLWSLDLLRGVVMFFLIAEATGLYDLLNGVSIRGTVFLAFARQLQHHPWHGIRLWDFGQPLFMFISGVAMVFSYGRRWARGETWAKTLSHAARRALVLFILGWALYLISPVENGGGYEFLLDILPQLAFAGFIGFLLIKSPAWVVAGSTLGLILTTELFYRLWSVPGFNQPFVPAHNFGSYLDLTLFGRLSEGNWVTFNIIPSAAFVLAGVLAGRLLKSGRTPSRIWSILALLGVSGVLVGLALDPLTPIIRHICTSSFVILSVGLCLLVLALAYGLADVSKVRIGSVFFVCVGMNPIFIYLFAFSGGAEWLQRVAAPFVLGFSRWTGGLTARIMLAVAVWGLMWALCRWLYGKKIFLKV